MKTSHLKLLVPALALGMFLASSPVVSQELDDAFDELRETVAGRAHSEEASETSRCHSVQRLLAGAVEMYNLDQNVNVTAFTPELLATLVEHGYLQRPPRDPGQGESSAGNYQLTASGIGITCRVHGPAGALDAGERRACFANQKVIAGAVEMYNLDFNVNVTALTPELFGELVERGYLSRVPEDPGQDRGSEANYRLTSAGNGIVCAVHGAVRGPTESERRACFANQKVIAGAVEMYNLDFNENVTALTPELFAKLVEQGYLSRLPGDPGQGAGSEAHYQLTSSGFGVTCTIHGSR